VAPPDGCDPVAWQRARVVAVARRYLGLSYRHHHIPAWDPPAALVGPTAAGTGLDCSNFTAWVYNYGLGRRFTSNVQQQADGPLAPGRGLAPDEPFAPGDLLFILREDRSEVSHVVVYVDENAVIDSHSAYGGVTEHPRTGWYLTHFSHARRIIEGSEAILWAPQDEPAGKLPAG
jgi:cell wall-associated NlpC family hydrolase